MKFQTQTRYFWYTFCFVCLSLKSGCPLMKSRFKRERQYFNSRISNKRDDGSRVYQKLCDFIYGRPLIRLILNYRVQIVCKIADVENHVVHFGLSFFLKSWKRLSVLTGSIAPTMYGKNKTVLWKEFKRLSFIKLYSFLVTYCWRSWNLIS